MMNYIRTRIEFIRRHGIRKYLYGIAKRIAKTIILIPDKLLYQILGEKYLHWRSQRYWMRAQNTYRGSSDYYERQDAALRSMMTLINGNRQKALDVGCGDGRFTLIIAERFEKVLGVDISSQLIEKAKESIESTAVTNVEFVQMDLTARYPTGTYNLVACMGVTSAIIADEQFSKLLNDLDTSIAPGGYLITKDSLSPSKQWEKFNGSYVAVYRNVQEYENKIGQLGFSLKQKQLLASSEHSPLVNYLYLWQRNKV